MDSTLGPSERKDEIMTVHHRAEQQLMVHVDCLLVRMVNISSANECDGVY